MEQTAQQVEKPCLPRYSTKNGTLGRRKPLQQAQELTVKALTAQGFSVRAIAAQLGASVGVVMRARKRLQARGEELSELLSPTLDQKAIKVVDHFLTEGVKINKIRGSDVMKAVDFYGQRRWPTRQESGPTTYNFTEINLGEFRADPLPSAVDVTPGPGEHTTRGIEPPQEKTDMKILNDFKGPEVR